MGKAKRRDDNWAGELPITATRNQILVQLELQHATRALRHARELCVNEGVQRNLDFLIGYVGRGHTIITANTRKEDELDDVQYQNDAVDRDSPPIVASVQSED